MPRPLPGYRLHKSSGQAVVTLNARDFYLDPWNSPASRVQYDRLIAEWTSHGRQLPQVVECGGLSIAELLVAYLNHARGYYARDGRPTSEYVAMKDALRPVRELYSKPSVREFGPLALKAVRQQMVDQGLSRKHINQRVNRIRRVFKWGVENEMVPPDILHGLQAVAPLKKGRTTARESEPVTPVPEEHVQAVLPLVSRQVAAMIQLQQFSGIRPGEVVLIRPADIDRSSSVWTFTPSQHKTSYRDQSRVIYLGPHAQAILKPWLLRDANAYCFSPKEAEAERNAIRRQNRKSPMTPSQAQRRLKEAAKRAKRDRFDRDSYRRAIEYAIQKAGVPHWHPHQLRHNCETRMRRDFGLDVAQAILGHRSARVTEVYAEIDKSKAISAVSRAG